MKVRDALLVLSVGIAIGFIVFNQKVEKDLWQQRAERHQQRIDSLENLLQIARDSLKEKQRIKIIERIKYEQIQPRTYSSPELDSLFRARYGKGQ